MKKDMQHDSFILSLYYSKLRRLENQLWRLEFTIIFYPMPDFFFRN